MASDPENTGSEAGSSSFLGGGPKFNQAGMNVPLPGEKVASVAPPPPLGGPRVWLGVLAVIVLIAVLWMVYGNGLGGVQSHGGRGGGVESTDRPSANPDAQ